MGYAIEQGARRCFDVTQQHLSTTRNGNPTRKRTPASCPKFHSLAFLICQFLPRRTPHRSKRLQTPRLTSSPVDPTTKASNPPVPRSRTLLFRTGIPRGLRAFRTWLLLVEGFLLILLVVGLGLGSLLLLWPWLLISLWQRKRLSSLLRRSLGEVDTMGGRVGSRRGLFLRMDFGGGGILVFLFFCLEAVGF